MTADPELVAARARAAAAQRDLDVARRADNARAATRCMAGVEDLIDRHGAVIGAVRALADEPGLLELDTASHRRLNDWLTPLRQAVNALPGGGT